jgi:hypothetical protein
MSGLIRTALHVCEGVRFHTSSTCRYCGGTLSGYDERRKKFAILLEDDKPNPVHVVIQRSYCRNCGNFSVPQGPFYPDTRIGSPVVDLCRSLSTEMSYSRASTYLGRMGVLVDRWSVRHYARTPLPEVPSVELFGMQIPVSIIALSTLAVSVPESGNPDMVDVLTACKYPFILL